MGDFTTAGEVESVTAHEVINTSMSMIRMETASVSATQTAVPSADSMMPTET